jgi:hypothetical protein
VLPLLALILALALSGGCTASLAGRTSGSVSKPKPSISASAVAYSRQMGGKSHEGETLYLVIATQDASESVVTRRLGEAEPHFGDTANYFVVLESQWFPELAPGQFILAEAHTSDAAAREALAWWDDRVETEWCRPAVRKVTVGTASPIPVVCVDVEQAP